MIKYHLLIIALFSTLLLGACAQDKVMYGTSEIILPTKTPTTIRTDANLNFETLPNTEPVPTIFTLSFQKSCLSIDEIDFVDLDLPEGDGIIVKYEETQGEVIRFIAPTLESSAVVFNSSVDLGEFLGVSSDGKWILIMLQEDPINTDDFAIRKIFVRALFEDEERLVASLQYEGSFYFGDLIVSNASESGYVSMSDVKFGPGASWASGGEIHILSQLAGSASTSQVFPVFTIDIITGEIEPFFDSHSLGMGEWYLGRYQFSDIPYDLFYTSFGVCGDCFGRFFLYDQFAHEEIPVLSWLEREDWMGWIWKAVSNAILWQTHDGTTNLLVPKQYGFDIAPNLSLQDMKDDGTYESRMIQMKLPPGSFQSHEEDMLSLGGVYTKWLSRYSNQAIFEGNLEEGSRYYLVDFDRLVIEEFCDSSIFPMINPIETDDVRFIAWERWNGDVVDTLILDMILSKIAVIEGVEFIGWVFESQ